MRMLLVCLGLLLAPSLANAQPAFYFHFGTGRLLEAEKSAEERLRNEPASINGTLPMLCTIYLKLRRYAKLADCTDRLESHIRAGHTAHSDSMVFESDITPLPHFLRSAAYLDLGDAKKSIIEGEAALAKLKPGSSWGMFTFEHYQVEALPVLGIAAMLEGRRDETERYLKMLAEVKVPYIGGQPRRNLQNIGLARLYISLGQYDKALEYLKEEYGTFARAVTDALLGGGDSFGNWYAFQKMLMIGKSNLELGRLAEAREALDGFIMHKRGPEQGDLYWIALYERGHLAERENKPEDAINYYRRAIEIIEEQRSGVATEAAKIGFAGNRQQVYARAVALLAAAGRAPEAFDNVERSKARALVDMLAGKRDFALRGPDAEKTRGVLAELDRADLNARTAIAALAAPDAAETRSVKDLRTDIASAAPELSSLVSVGAIPAGELRGLLGADETLIEYYYDEAALYAFIVTRESIEVAKLERAGLAEAVTQFRRRLEAAAGDLYVESAQGLHARLVAPLQPRIKGGPLTLVAHGALHYLPFAALQDGEGKFLIDRYALRALPSASVLKFLRPASAGAPAAGLLAIGNPDLNDPKLDLNFAEGEARAVAALFPESRVLVRKDATKANFRKAAGVFNRIHIASHGKFRADAPLDSGLLLAPEAGDDGLLRVSELYSIEMNADLVTLSACETGLGKIDNGDDVVGLTRGFLYAGARSIVASLWSVDDRGTAELMKAFYENLRGAQGTKIEALRQAQIRTRATFAHPFFWASFQLIGRPD